MSATAGAARALLALAAALATQATASAAAAAPLLQPFRAVYEVHMDGRLRGESTLSLERSNDGWRYTMQVEATRGLAGLGGFEATQVSDFSIVAGQPRLQRSVSTQSVLLREREVVTEFDWQHGQARWRGDVDAARRGPLPLGASAINAHLLNLALGLDVRGRAAGEVLHYQLLERGRSDAAAWRIGEAERVQTGFGAYHATPLVRAQPAKDRITTAWYAPGLPPTPVRVLRTEHGKPKFELRLLSLDPR